jgi:hypothetical protein
MCTESFLSEKLPFYFSIILDEIYNLPVTLKISVTKGTGVIHALWFHYIDMDEN